MHIRKAVLPVAGLGTRVLPATKVVPKELLPIVDKPVLQYIVEEAVAAGVQEIIFVNSAPKRSVEDHFDRSFEVERLLERKGRFDEAERLRHITQMAKYVAVRQAQALGLGHAVLCAKTAVGNEPFFVMLGDELYTKEQCLPGLVEAYEQCRSSVLALFTVPENQISSYGIASVIQEQGDVLKIGDLVEKPLPGEAPSNLALAGRYLLTPDIFEILEKTPAGRGGEIQLTDALREQAHQGRCYGILFEGQRLDTGTPQGLLQASVIMALRRGDIGPDFRKFLEGVL